MKQHLQDRGVNLDLYTVAIDEEQGVATFFLYDLSGRIVGYQRYFPLGEKKRNNDPTTGKYFTRTGYLKDGVFGLEYRNDEDPRMFVVEGLFKATKLHALGYNAIAVLGATPKPLRPWFWLLNKTYDLWAVGDDDEAGRKLANYVGKGFVSPLDLDEMSDEAVHELVVSHTQ